MNIVLLCKSWNHAKALDILEALHEQQLAVRGIVAFAAPKSKTTFSEVIRKVHTIGAAGALSRLRARSGEASDKKCHDSQRLCRVHPQRDLHQFRQREVARVFGCGQFDVRKP